MTRDSLDGLVSLMRGNWEIASQVIGDMGLRVGNPEVGMQWAEALKQNILPEAAALMLTGLYDSLDVRPTLKDVSCPTLIIGPKDDTSIPFAASQRAAALLPNAKLVAMPGSGPLITGPEVDEAMRIVGAFLDEDPEMRALTTGKAPTRRPDMAFRTVLFTDLVGHTEMMSRLGDERGRDVLREHERITREVLKANGGTEVKTMGDGFMASFGSVTRSVECAIALQRAFAERDGEPLSVRVGLNAGEPIEEEGDLFGATVILASRIAAKADGGEILVADTVRGLCSGKGFLFADRGEFVAKGIAEPVRISEVNWSSSSQMA
jgi:class 3 adenylate cyclase